MDSAVSPNHLSELQDLYHATINIHIIENLPGTHFFSRNALISGVYIPISSKFCMEVALWTAITGKLLWFGFHGNRCYGDKNTSSKPNNYLFWGCIQVGFY